MLSPPTDQSLDLPPLYRAIGLREVGDAFATAVKIAPAEGAGTLVWTRRFDLVEVAVVLEPDEPLATARRAFFAGMNATADALAAHCPPEKPITFAWPDTIMLDRGLVGGARLAWPADADERQPPPFLVFGLMLRLMMQGAERSIDHAANSDRTSLEAEGFEMLDPRHIIASFTRHLMNQVDRWQAHGFAGIGADYLARLSPQKGTRRGIDPNGDLLVHHIGGKQPAERRALVPALAACSWLDRSTGEPYA